MKNSVTQSPPHQTVVDMEKQIKDLRHDLAAAEGRAKNALSDLQYWRGQYETATAPAPAEHVMGDGEASIIECLAAGKPFVFDPATNFLHADDGTVEGGIRYMPVPAHHTGRLLPCPFCGGEPEFQESNPYDQSDDVAFTVFCRECGTEHPWRSTPEDAVAFWNRRAALASAEVEG